MSQRSAILEGQASVYFQEELANCEMRLRESPKDAAVWHYRSYLLGVLGRY